MLRSVLPFCRFAVLRFAVLPFQRFAVLPLCPVQSPRFAVLKPRFAVLPAGLKTVLPFQDFPVLRFAVSVLAETLRLGSGPGPARARNMSGGDKCKAECGRRKGTKKDDKGRKKP